MGYILDAIQKKIKWNRSETLLSFSALQSFIQIPLIIYPKLDTISKGNQGDVKRLTLIWLGIVFGSAIFNGIQTFIFSYTNRRFGQELRLDLFKEVLSKDVQFFDSRKTGDIMSRLQTDVQKI